jgi:hypothetical protein
MGNDIFFQKPKALRIIKHGTIPFHLTFKINILNTKTTIKSFPSSYI